MIYERRHIDDYTFACYKIRVVNSGLSMDYVVRMVYVALFLREFLNNGCTCEVLAIVHYTTPDKKFQFTEILPF